MKYFLILIATASVISCTSTDKKSSVEQALHDSTTKVAMANEANYTTVEWIDSTFRDLGKVAKGQTLEITWEFKNTGDKALFVEEAHASCGCTVADKPEEPIAPGKTGKIIARFNTEGRGPGTESKNVTVTANMKPSKTQVLSFTVDITEK